MWPGFPAWNKAAACGRIPAFEAGIVKNDKVSRLTIGMITAAFIIGTSIMLSVIGETEYFGMSMLAVLGFAIACVGGVWVLLSIWRGRH